jgi:ATP-dependent helicase HrpA
VWDEEAFTALTSRVRAGVEEETRRVLHDVTRVLGVWRETDRALSGSAALPMLPALADMKAQVGRLVHRGFVADVGAAHLRELPRYLKAVQVRLEKLPDSVGRDRMLMDQVAALQEAYLHRVAALPDGRVPSADLERVRWMLEELRVSLWAQQLGTAYPVSDTRIRKALDAA